VELVRVSGRVGVGERAADESVVLEGADPGMP
jgi:hypothetical protein